MRDYIGLDFAFESSRNEEWGQGWFKQKPCNKVKLKRWMQEHRRDQQSETYMFLAGLELASYGS
jgi:hypothetical protein